MKTVLVVMSLLVTVSLCYSERNVILLIPDGASTDLVTLSRLYKWYSDSTRYTTEPLAVDKLFCGMVRTYCKDHKFPDSAPTSTAYATGTKTIAPYIGLDSASHPQVSVMELAKMYGYATGIVATCEFPHATPADFLCHFNSRESQSYKNLAKQMIHNSPNVLFTGGYQYVTSNNYEKDIVSNKIHLITEYASFAQLGIASLPNDCERVWGLFSDYRGGSVSKSFQCDRDAKSSAPEPSLSIMTKKAIGILDTLSRKNMKGFFLMVEGSQIDWANHYNDPYAAVTEFIEFDNAVKIAVEFAQTHDSTLVVVCPDHGTGGMSIGNRHSSPTLFHTADFDKNYDKIDYPTQVIRPLSKIKCSARRIADTLLGNPKMSSLPFIRDNYNVVISKADSVEIRKVATCDWAPNDKRDFIEQFIGNKFSERHFIGWTTNGHTGEDVFLGIKSPAYYERLTGIVDNATVGHYIAGFFNYRQLQEDSMDLAADDLFYSELTPDRRKNHRVVSTDSSMTLQRIKHKKITGSITLIPNVNYYLVDTTVVYTKTKTLILRIQDTFYVPEEVLKKLTEM